MENYIRCYDNVVPDSFCDDMIKQFELSVEHHERHSQGEMSFAQLHLMAHDEWKTEVAYLIDVFKESIKRYREDCKIGYESNIWPQKYSFEGMRLKRYLADGVDQFGKHINNSYYNLSLIHI